MTINGDAGEPEPVLSSDDDSSGDSHSGGNIVSSSPAASAQLDDACGAAENPTSIRIDNSHHVYIPVTLKCGMLALCRPEVLRNCPAVLEDLNQDLSDCLEILPPSVHPLVRRTKIWLNMSYRVGRKDKPQILNHTTAHHHEAWLIWAKDRPDKALSIEVYSCEDFRRMRLHWNGCGLMLHELGHLIHQLCLPDGLDNRDVKEAYERAKISERYEQVLRRDWAGKDVDCDLHYAMVDHREFFAEMSVTYWSCHYRELDREVCYKMEKASPPIIAHSVISNIARRRQTLTKWSDAGKLVEAGRTMPHCNKFYPFTCGQLRRYDQATFQAIEKAWHEISRWVDPVGGIKEKCCASCWHPRIGKRINAVESTVSDTIDL